MRGRASAPAPLRIELTKALPAEAGLGGGSSDAAAALRLLNGLLERPLAEAALIEIAAGLGSDIPACVAARSVVAEGRGERLSPAPALPPLHAVLVRPPAGASTAAVYRCLRRGERGNLRRPACAAGPLASASDAAAFLAACRNDLEAPAVSVQPLIGEALALLRGQPETLLGRMSGSGSACFAVCASAEDARRAGRAGVGRAAQLVGQGLQSRWSSGARLRRSAAAASKGRALGGAAAWTPTSPPATVRPTASTG